MNETKLFRIIGLVFGLIGLLLLVWCWFSYQNTAAFLTHAIPTSGQVIKNEHRNSSGGKTTCYPVIAFATERGEHTEFTSNGSGLCAYAVGETVPVLYDPAVPSQAREHSFWGLWLLTAMLGAMGLGFTTLGFTGWWINLPLPPRPSAKKPSVPRPSRGRRQVQTD
jgi:hypothetical protein